MPAIDKYIPQMDTDTHEGLRLVILGFMHITPMVICGLLVVGTAFGEETSSLLPGDPTKGGEVFFSKGCSQCHAVLGEGGLTAPDLAHTPSGHLNAAQIAAAMWNHAPQMWERIKVEHLSIPKVKEKEMADLFAFLYAIRYFDEPGNLERGKELLEEKGCIQCHSLKGEGGKIAPDLARWGSFANPILWAQVMWNKAPLMEEAIKDKGLTWPEFEGSEMVDLPIRPFADYLARAKVPLVTLPLTIKM
jgi:cytochrome c2